MESRGVSGGVLDASRNIFWPIYAKPGNEAATAEPTLGASRRDGKAWGLSKNVRNKHAVGAVLGEVCVEWSLIYTIMQAVR